MTDITDKEVTDASVPAAGRLRRGAIGLVGLTTLGAVMMSPALGMYGNWGPMAALVGKPTPLVFLLSLVVALPTAISYATISRELPSTGSAFSWVRLTMNRDLGNWVGLIMSIYYIIAALIQPIFFGLFLNDLLRLLGLPNPGLPTIVLGLLVVTAIGAFLTFRGVRESTRVVVIFVIIEIATVVALSITILVVKAPTGQLNFDPINPALITGGANNFLLAMILGVFSFTGFDVISTVAEEAKAPRRLLPRATLLAVVAVGLFWALNSYVFSVAVPVKEIQSLASSGLTAATPIAGQYWGEGRIAVIITALTAVTAVYIATVTGASRALFALGRQGVLPRRLGRLHPRYNTPWTALVVVFAASLIGGIGGIIVLGNGLDAFVWWANSLAFFALITYIFVNSSAIAYFLKARRTGTRWNPLLHLILPVIGILFDAYLIYQAFFVALWGSGFRTGQSVVIFGVALALVAIIWTLVVRARKGDDATTNIAEADDVIARETEERDQQDRLRAAGSGAE